MLAKVWMQAHVVPITDHSEVWRAGCATEILDAPYLLAINGH
jgi:hypothetical protein